MTTAAIANEDIRAALRAHAPAAPGRARAPRWRKLRMPKRPAGRPFGELAALADERDNRPVAALRRALQGAPRPAAFPVLTADLQLFGVGEAGSRAVEGRYVLGLDADGRVRVSRTVIYANGYVAIEMIYCGPNARLAVDKLNESRRQAQWANAFAAGRLDDLVDDPVSHGDAFNKLRQMRAWIRTQP